MLVSQRVVQVCLLLVAAIALFGGALQMYRRARQGATTAHSHHGP